MWRMIIDSGAALKFSSRPGQKSLLDKMRYTSYNDREGEVLQERKKESQCLKTVFEDSV